MGHMKDLLITVYGGGDEAVAAVDRMSKDWREQLEQAADEIERLWIPVEERMPAEGTIVLAWDGTRIVFGYARDGQWIDTLYGWVIPDGPRHWMPLPEPPEVK